MAKLIKCEKKIVGSVTIFSVAGKMRYGYPQEILEIIQTELSNSNVDNFLLNLTEVSRLNSDWIGFIILTYKFILLRNGRYALVSSNVMVNGTLNRLGLTHLFKLYENEEEAIKELTS